MGNDNSSFIQRPQIHRFYHKMRPLMPGRDYNKSSKDIFCWRFSCSLQPQTASIIPDLSGKTEACYCLCNETFSSSVLRLHSSQNVETIFSSVNLHLEFRVWAHRVLNLSVEFSCFTNYERKVTQMY